MQLELTLTASDSDAFPANDLGYLLHKNPNRVFSRSVSNAVATIFYPENSATRSTAVLHVDVDPIALVRGKNSQVKGLLDQYVNTRPYAANSMLSVAINKCFAQSMGGRSKDRQSMAEERLQLQATVVPVLCQGDEIFVKSLFEPLGYDCTVESLGSESVNNLFSIRLSAMVRLADLLNHLYVLVPVLDNSKHWWVDEDEVEKLFSRASNWLCDHPMKELICRRSLKNRRDLSNKLLDLLNAHRSLHSGDSDDVNGSIVESDEADGADVAADPPVRLHDQRIDRVAQLLKESSASRVLDIGCGEGKLIQRLLKMQQFKEIVGVDPSLRALKRARDKFYLEDGGEKLNERLRFQLGSLTYADRRLRGFDAASLVEVIEHIDSNRIVALERSLFGDARPGMVVVTTPNADYNTVFENLTAGDFRHEDHRFEWTRSEFSEWCHRVAEQYGYEVWIEPLGPTKDDVGAPSQLGKFTLRTGVGE